MPPDDERPNILFLMTDQQRFDTIAALGNPHIRTPALDRLVRSGVAFTCAYSPSPVCVSARCSLHYGQYPMRTGCYANGYAMPDDRPSFMQMLTEAGYRTHGIGKCHFTPDRFALRGFQSRETQEEAPRRAGDDYARWLDEQGWGDLPEPHGVRGEMYYIPQVSQLPARLHPSQWIGDRSVAFIRQQRDNDQPWLLMASFIHPHPPFAPPSPWHKLYRSFRLPPPNVPDDWAGLQTFINRHQNRYKYRDQGIDRHLVRNIKAHYYACISFVDYQIGRILDALDATGRSNRTLIVFTSDHGELLGDYHCFGKRSMHDAAARVPLLVSMPGRFDGGSRCDRPASLVDVMPTLLAAAGIPVAGTALDGVDLHALHEGRADRPAVFAQHDTGPKGLYTLIDPRWTYAYSAADQTEYLFDRLNDPAQTRNAAVDRSNRPRLEALRTQLIDWLRAGGESSAIDGGQWRAYPRLEVSPDPDVGLITQDPPDFVLALGPYAP